MEEKQSTIILGIDPGSRITGFGLVKLINGSSQYLASGCIKIKAGSIPERLKQIHHDLTEIIEQYRPDEAAVEDIFVSANLRGALKLGQARGAAITTIVHYDIPVAEYTARQVKQAVVGYGAADKVQVQEMVKTLLNLPGLPQADAADALAIALCHTHTRDTLKQVDELTGISRGRWR